MAKRSHHRSRILARLLLCCFLIRASGESSRVTVVYSSDASPYTEALDGLRSALAGVALTTVDLEAPNSSAMLGNSLETSTQLVIAIGSDALQAVSARKIETPLLATMIMHSEQARHHVTGAIHLDIPLAEVLARLKSIFPGKTRIAMVRSPVARQMDNASLARSRQQGFILQQSEAGNPEELLHLLRGLKGQVDFVLCLPDSSLYNSTTIKHIILASLESRLIVVGFSQSFVRAGAAVGIYPDFRDVGAQTAEVAQRQLAGQDIALEESPRKVVVAVNQRVIRLLGLDYQARPGQEVTILR